MKIEVERGPPGCGIVLVKTGEFGVVVSDGGISVMGHGWSYMPKKDVINYKDYVPVEKCSETTLAKIASIAVRDYKRFKKESLGGQEFPKVTFAE